MSLNFRGLDRLRPTQLKPGGQTGAWIAHPAMRAGIGPIRRRAPLAMHGAGLAGDDVGRAAVRLLARRAELGRTRQIGRIVVCVADEIDVIAQQSLLDGFDGVSIAREVRRQPIVRHSIGRGRAHALPDDRAGGHDTRRGKGDVAGRDVAPGEHQIARIFGHARTQRNVEDVVGQRLVAGLEMRCVNALGRMGVDGPAAVGNGVVQFS